MREYAIAVLMHKTSIHFFRSEIGIAYLFLSYLGVSNRLFGYFVLISFRSSRGILIGFARLPKTVAQPGDR